MQADNRNVQRRTNNTREQELIDATLKCIAEHGLENTTVRKIAEFAGVTNGLIRFYFNTKEEIIRAAYEHFLENILFSSIPDLGSSKFPHTARLAEYIRMILSPPITSSNTVMLWASFLPLAQKDPDMAKIRREFYDGTLGTFTTLTKNAYAELELDVDEAMLQPRVVALNSFVDGLWVNGSVPDTELYTEKLVDIGLRGGSSLLQLPLLADAA